MKALLVFVAVAIADAIWAKYIQACAGRKVWTAAALSALIVLLGGFTTLAVVSDPRYLAPAAIGAVAGTWAACR